MSKVYNETGLVLQAGNFTIVKKAGVKGDLIPKHNHPEANVTFTVVKGKVKAFINESTEYILTPGDILHFDGDNYINAEFLEESEALVHLILK